MNIVKRHNVSTQLKIKAKDLSRHKLFINFDLSLMLDISAYVKNCWLKLLKYYCSSENPSAKLLLASNESSELRNMLTCEK